MSGTRAGRTPTGPGKAKGGEGNRRGADASGAMARGGVTRAGGRMEVPVARARPAEAPAGFVRLLPPAGRRPSTPPLGPASPAPCVPGRSGASVDVSSALYTLTRTYAGVFRTAARTHDSEGNTEGSPCRGWRTSSIPKRLRHFARATAILLAYLLKRKFFVLPYPRGWTRRSLISRLALGVG